MIKRCTHLSRRICCLAALGLLLTAFGGCALWNKEVWNLNRYRDERAVDIDHRLERSTPPVQNPF